MAPIHHLHCVALLGCFLYVSRTRYALRSDIGNDKRHRPVYMGCMRLLFLAQDMTPDRYRLPWRRGSIVVEGSVLRRNARLGLHIKF